MILVISADSVRDCVQTVESFDCFEVFLTLWEWAKHQQKNKLTQSTQKFLFFHPVPGLSPWTSHMDYPEMDYAAEV